MKKWQYISLWSLSLILFLGLISWSQGRYQELRIQGLEMTFENRGDQSFLDPSEIQAIVASELGEIKGLLLSEINKALLEESIENHPTIAKAEVYSGLDGTLRIMLWQHEPLARVLSPQATYYLLENGAKMPLSPHYSEAVPLVNGELDPQELREVADFFAQLQKDPFFKEAFTGLTCQPDGNWTLYPRRGDFKVQLGKAEKIKQKLAKLRVFYEQAPLENEIETIREIDLRFEDQLICRKR